MATRKKNVTDHKKETKTPVTSKKKQTGRDTSKSSAAKPKSSSKSTSTKSTSKKSAPQSDKRSARTEIDMPDISRKKRTSVVAEIWLWMMLAFCLILFLGVMFQAGGMVGRGTGRFFFGMFGVMAYTMPFVLFFSTAFLIANHGRGKAWIKVVAVWILVISLSCFFALVSNPISSSITLSEYYEICMNGKNGGGIAGGIIYLLFHPILGEIGTWICNIILFIIGMVMLTGYSVFDSIREESGNAIGHAHTQSQIKRELSHQRKRQAQLRRQVEMKKEIEEIRNENQTLSEQITKPRRQRIVTGVSTNTTFDMNLPVSEDIHEVVPKASQKAKVSELSEPVKLDPAKAKKVEETLPELPESVPAESLQFTIQRDGHSQIISATPTLGMPEFLEEAAQKKAANTAKEAKEAKEVKEVTEAAEVKEDEIPKEEKIVSENSEEITAKTKIKNPHSSKEEQEKALDSVAEEIRQNEEVEKAAYVFPPLDLLKKPSGSSGGNSDDEVTETARKLQETLHSFGVNVTVTNVSCGPAVTRYELLPEQGVKVSKIVSLADDIKLNLAAEDIRIEAPIPGKAAVGIEVPNKENSAVYLRELLESAEFQNAKSNLSFAVGKDIAGKVVVTDIAKMPHLLIAGATGSGKSVCINTLIMSIIYKADPEDVKLIMIDPKVVELSVYNGIPHLFIPVVTDPKKASGALNWGVAEMTDRYQKFADAGVRDLKGYNEKVAQLADVDDPNKPKKLPQIVIIVDELADLMMVAPGEVEDAICRLAQLARAAGIHLIIATQRPSVNVITGLIKANMPSRIAFSVTSGVDSRTILDMTGAEKLLGKGDMLFYPQGYSKPVRVQGSFVSDAEVSKVTEFLTQKNDMSVYHKQMETRMNTIEQSASVLGGTASGSNELDSNFVQAGKFIIEKDKASIGMLQRVFKIGFNRAARIMDQLSEAGVVGPEEGTKPRKVLMSMEEFEQYIDENV